MSTTYTIDARNSTSNLILTIEDGSLFEFRSRFEDYLMREYNVLGKAIVNNEELEFNVQDLPVYEPYQTPDHALVDRIKLENKLQLELKHHTETNKIPAFSDIKMHLSKESLARVQTNEQYPAALQQMNPILLWQIVINEHSSNGASLSAQRMRLMNTLMQMKQQPNDDAEQHATKFYNLLVKLEALGNNLNDEAQTHIFIQSLDKKRNQKALDNVWNHTPIIDTFLRAK